MLLVSFLHLEGVLPKMIVGSAKDMRLEEFALKGGIVLLKGHQALLCMVYLYRIKDQGTIEGQCRKNDSVMCTQVVVVLCYGI
ncbi:LOW QUALITY PROTEIN: hypothetical protein ACHAW6_006763 [Cyclotella cf. meneghiniana]